MPRTGIPERFQSYAEYKRHVDVLVKAGLIEDSTKIWWDLRPSGRFPTIEVRVMDVCTRLDDCIAIVALLISVVRMLYRLRLAIQRWRLYTTMLIRENRWRAMRYSFDEGLIDLAKGAVVPVGELLDELIQLTAEDAEALGCSAEVASLRDIMTRGTSAHRQLATFSAAKEGGASPEDALKAVVDRLVADTAKDLDAR